MADERSPGGSAIYRHAGAAPAEAMPASPLVVEAVRAHLLERLGPISALPQPSPLPFETFVVRPADEDEPLAIVTIGASASPMRLPDGVTLPARFELMMRLPRDWHLDDEDRRWAWPLAWLRAMAQLPARFGSWLGAGHTVPNGDPPRPIVAGTELCCFLLVPPAGLDDGADIVSTAHGEVTLLCAVPIYASELGLLLERGFPELVARLSAAGVDDVIDLGRQPVC